MSKKPGTNTGDRGGIFQEVTAHGRKVHHFATVADNKPLPPTTKAGNKWTAVRTTPSGKR